MSRITRTGHVLLNPQEKRLKYFDELRGKTALTNDWKVKKDKSGKKKTLSKQQRAYRSGYIQAQNDSAACYNAKRGIKKGKKRK